MKTIARFVTRPTGQKGDGPPDLLLGTCFKGQKALTPGTIYEIQEIMGQLVIVELGSAAIGYTHKTTLISQVSWSNEVSWILECSGGKHLLTKAEILTQRKKP